MNDMMEHLCVLDSENQELQRKVCSFQIDFERIVGMVGILQKLTYELYCDCG